MASYTFSTSQPQAYRIQADDVGAFIRAQLQITGTFDEFQLSMFDLTYRVRPQHMTYLDTGYLIGDDPADIVWLQEVEIDANSPSDLVLQTYLDDRLWDTQTGVELVPPLRHQSQVMVVALAPDNGRILTLARGHTAHLWSLSGEPIAILRGHQGAIWDAAFSPDESRIATASLDWTGCD